MKIPKVVIDTNIFLSATILKGSTAVLMDCWKEDKFVLLFSADIFDEYFEVIARPKFAQEESDIRALAELLTEKGIAVEPKIRLDVVKDDPDDNKFLECALAGEADFIVSGDRHLLSLNKYKGVRILKAADFLKELERK